MSHLILWLIFLHVVSLLVAGSALVMSARQDDMEEAQQKLEQATKEEQAKSEINCY